jgi:Holliday junction resolvase RusA-like endonuclease
MAEIKCRFECQIKEIQLVSKNKKKTIGKKIMPNGKLANIIINTQEYNNLKELLTFLFKRSKSNDTLVGKTLIEVYVSTYKDIINIDEPVFDSLEDAGIIDNDRNVAQFYTKKKFLKRGQIDSLTVKVYQ